MLIDLHNHTTLSSLCSVLHPEDLIRLCMERGLDAVCVTEHDTRAGGEAAMEMGKKAGFTVIPGMEVHTEEGDILTFGIRREGLAGISVAELARIAQLDGGVLIPAHPYRLTAASLHDSLFKYPGAFTAIEVLNGNCGSPEIKKAAAAALRLGLPMTGGSDAHGTRMAGRYCTDFPAIISNETELVTALKAGGFKPVSNPGYRNTP